MTNNKYKKLYNLKNIIILIVFLFLFITNIKEIKANNSELVLLSPINKYYETNENIEKLRINLDYFSTYNETWLIINNQRMDLRHNNFIEKFTQLEEVNIQNTNQTFSFDKISNYFEYSFSIIMTGRGTADINLSNKNEIGKIGIKYINDWDNEIWQCYNGSQYVTISQAKKDIKYDFIIRTYREGLKFNLYEVWINNEKKANCLIHDEINSIEEINFDVKATTAIVSEQILKSGTYYVELPSGKHKVTLNGKNDNDIKNISAEFYVVINECGNLICDGNKNVNNCPSDCKEIICNDNGFVGDTNNDNIIDAKDKTNLINIIDERIPKPERDCCVDINRDGIVNYKDLEILEKIILGEISKEICYIGCNDGTEDNQCSRNKPYFCDYGNLFKDCNTCGCPDDNICMDDGSCFNLNNCKCSDIASNPKNPLNYDNVVDDYDLDLLKNNIGLCLGNENYNEKFDLNYDNCIDEKDIKCIMFNFDKKTLCSGPQVCVDGTLSNECSNKLPLFCEKDQLIFKCETCGCPMYMQCQNDGTCTSFGNFEIIIEEKSSNESKRYMEGGSIFIPLLKDSSKEIEFILNPLKDLENITFKIDLDKEFIGLYDMNIELSKRINLKKDEKRTIKIDFIDNNNELGTYKGKINILINGYEFSSIPIEIHIRESVSMPYLELKEEKNYTYLLAIIFVLIAILFLVLFILRIRKREKALLKKLEVENRIILK
jgi:hypothetical protein